MLILLGLGCTDEATDDQTSPTLLTDPTTTVSQTTDGTTTTTSSTTRPTGLNGTVPPVSLPPPVFTAYNRDGAVRTQPDLVGAPTVMWFYPAAFTGG